jgi:protoheme IX farnesyltransferase
MNAVSVPAKRVRVGDFAELTKPRITLLVVATAAVGFLAASPAVPEFVRLAHLLVGTALAAGGASALNQYMEREQDARMRRTMFRPIPSGRVLPQEALQFGTTLAISGCLYLWAFVNGLPALLACMTVGSYIGVYTPSKRYTSFSTAIGAVPGALPPLGGWAGARSDVGLEAWPLFGILFLWQLPHFLAIARLYREDYARAGMPVLPVLDATGALTGRQVCWASLVLVPMSLLPSVVGVAGTGYFLGALVLGVGFVGVAARMAVLRHAVEARRVLVASVLYLPLLLALLVVDRVPMGL